MKEVGWRKELMSAIEAKEHREVDAAEGGVTWKAVSEAHSSKAEVGPSGESRFGVNRKDPLEETRRRVRQSWDCSQQVGREVCDGLARG